MYLGSIFEAISMQAFLQWSAQIGVSWDRLGRWWYKDTEIDLLALSSARKELMIGEIKWTKKPISRKYIELLIKKTKQVQWRNTNRKEKYILISRGGFSSDCKEYLEDPNIMFWTLADICNIFCGNSTIVNK